MDEMILKQIYNKIKEYKKIIITPHARPDGDCIGSALGLKDIIKSTYPEKAVYVTGESSDFTSFLGKLDTIEDSIFEGALVIAVDTANEQRIADQRYKLGDFLIKIDHHINVSSYGDIEYVDTSRPAAALIILDLFNLFKDEYKMSPDGAKALFTGTLTDTGRFKYPGVDGDTFRNVATLYDLGLQAQSVYSVLDTRSEASVRFKGYVLLNYQKTENGVAYIEITEELINDYGVTIEEASSFVNELGVFEDCPIWVLLAEYEEKIVRARIRSKGPVINEVAGLFDGGGHALASGANLGTWDKAKELLVVLDETAKKYKESK
ncbi:DHH family phosphoesterase [Liberiplasma polymorphum]|jgi:bifunctional oligoribonuclease and PAP phosphatase NrnA|uniref:DHH family phosphoesterase n=1 Tax=Liberiplasma polymorphum TaxID=3374570 RepID=UPI003775D68C